MTVQTRNEQLLAHYPLAQRIARRIHQRLPKSAELDDLVSAGVLGLIEALERYDDGSSVPFESFARHRIRGAVLDSIRAADWAPSSVRRKATLLEKAREELVRHLGRPPTRTEMAGALDMSPKKLDDMVTDSRSRKVLSLDAPIGPHSTTALEELLDSGTDLLSDLQRAELEARVLEAHQQLPDRERDAIALYYLEDKKLREVGEALGVTESRACQLCKAAVSRLQKRLAEAEGEA